MKIKLSDVKNAEVALGNLAGMDLPIKAGFKFSRLVGEVGKELTVFEEQRIKLIKTYDTKLDSGDYTVPADKIPEFQKAMEELGSVEVDLTFEPLKLDELGDIKVKPIELFFLKDFIIA